MTDQYKQLRDAIAAKPQNWPKSSIEMRGKSLLDAGIDFVFVNPDGRDKSLENANFIAAANPNAIRALLAERDALRHALAELTTTAVVLQGNIQSALKSDDKWSGVAEAVQPHIDAARAALSQGEAP